MYAFLRRQQKTSCQQRGVSVAHQNHSPSEMTIPNRFPSYSVAGFKSGSHNVQKEELADQKSSQSSQSGEINPQRKGDTTTSHTELDASRCLKYKERHPVGLVRSRPASVNRRYEGTRAHSRRASSGNLYDSVTSLKQVGTLMHNGRDVGFVCIVHHRFISITLYVVCLCMDQFWDIMAVPVV